jgi:hypothetical protein
MDYLRSAYQPAYAYYLDHALAAITRKRDVLTWMTTQPDFTDPLPAHLILRPRENDDLRQVAYNFDFNDRLNLPDARLGPRQLLAQCGDLGCRGRVAVNHDNVRQSPRRLTGLNCLYQRATCSDELVPIVAVVRLFRGQPGRVLQQVRAHAGDRRVASGIDTSDAIAAH